MIFFTPRVLLSWVTVVGCLVLSWCCWNSIWSSSSDGQGEQQQQVRDSFLLLKTSGRSTDPHHRGTHTNAAHNNNGGHTTVFHLIPHSHCDAAYKKTFDEYYETEVRHVLNSTLAALMQQDKPRRRFVWAETSYLTRWWKDPRTSQQDKQLFQDLFVRGTIEIVNGGWVMHDEGITRYDSQIHQMTEGHNRLREMLLDPLRRPDVSVTTGWQIDPFGPSPFSVNLHDWAGMEFLVLNRIPSNVKDALKSKQMLQFYWETQQARVLVHIMDTHYASPIGFDWEDVEHGDPILITKENVQERSDVFMDMLAQRAVFYRTPHVMVPMGGDFTFQNASLQFQNMERITDYVKSHPDRYGNVSFRYSTSTEYKERVLVAFNESQQSIPIIREGVELQPLLAGYYFTLPNLKQMLRTCEIVLRAVDVRLYQSLYRDVPWNSISRWIETTRLARETVGLMQHHDAITGTSYRFVIADYMQRLASTLQSMARLVSRIEAESQEQSQEYDRVETQDKVVGGGPYLHETVLVRDAQTARSISVDRILSPQMGSSSGTSLLVLNSLGHETTTLVHFVCTRDDVGISLVSDDGTAVPVISQATPLDHELEVSNLGLFLISFPATLPGFGRGRYRLQVCDLTWSTFQNPPVYIPSLECAHKAVSILSHEMVESGLHSSKLQVGFNETTLEIASLSYVRHDGAQVSTSVNHDFILYWGGNDTLYQFNTNLESSNPPPLFGSKQRRFVSGFKGRLFSQVTLEYTPWLSIRYRLTNATLGPLDGALQATVFAGPLPSPLNLASRFRTTWSKTKWFVEENGYLPAQVTYNASHGVGDWNTRPFVSRSWISDESSGRRLSVYTVDPRGVVSKRSGQMDVFWHRRNNFTPDWWKQGDDRSSVVSSVWIGLSLDRSADEFHSRQMATQLSNDVVLLTTPAPHRKWNTKVQESRMRSVLPESLHSVTLRLVQVDSDIDPDREEAWIELQVENLSSTSSNQVDLTTLFSNSSKIVLPAATLNSLTFLTTKSDVHSSQRQIGFDGCNLDVTNGGLNVVLSVHPRRICSVRVPLAPLRMDTDEVKPKV